MNNKIKKSVTIFLTLLLITCGLSGCSLGERRDPPPADGRDSGRPPRTPVSSFDIASIKSYREIPGVTLEEIAAIEALKSTRQSFTYGSILTT